MTNPPVPVHVLTGFLGSGKTTLLRRLLRDPGMGRTAVIVNEFGEIGIDHDLVASSTESFVELTTGCLCCRVRSDLVETLASLAVRRDATAGAKFDRVVIETSGLADPAAILHALMTDAEIAPTYALGTVVTTVDAVLGADTLARHDQSVRQVAAADRIVVTKTDACGGLPDDLAARIGTLNPRAPRMIAVQGAISAQDLFGHPLPDGDARAASLVQWLDSHDGQHATHHHDVHIGSFVLVRDEPVHAAALALFLEALAEHCGDRLLRVKGLVHVAEVPEQPAVIHGVQHVFHPPEWLDHWPGDDRRTRIVFIGRDVPQAWPAALLEVLDAEAAEELARRRGSAAAPSC